MVKMTQRQVEKLEEDIAEKASWQPGGEGKGGASGRASTFSGKGKS